MTGMIAEAQTSVWNGNRRLWTRGEGTESNPYLIESAENLAFLSYMVNKGIDTRGLYFELTTDIDLNGSEDQPWYPIGMGNSWFADDGCERIVDPSFNINNVFAGHFDGGGHSIYNLYVDGLDYAGLFGCLYCWYDEGTTIENVSIESGYIHGKSSGGIVGECEGIVYIANCQNNAEIEGTEAAGGIVGTGGKVISKCSNSGHISSSYIAGGIAGMMAKEVTECFNTGSIIVNNGYTAGGILGRRGGGQVVIANCYNRGDLSGSADYGIGGIAGIANGNGNTTNIRNCYNVGSIANDGGDAGGLFGYYEVGHFENVYYLNTCGGWGLGTSKTAEEMRDPAFVNTLNHNTDVWGFDEDNINDGYPILTGTLMSTDEATTMMSIYPNPVKDQLSLTFANGIKPENVTLYDLQGRLVETKHNDMEIIDMSAMPAGVYMLHVIMKDGTSYHEKILKE